MHDTVIGLLINKVVVDATFMLDYRFHPLPSIDLVVVGVTLPAGELGQHQPAAIGQGSILN